MKKKIIRLSSKEDVTVTKAANSDSDSHPLTDKQWAKVKPSLTRGRGRPLGSGSKEQVTLRIDSDTTTKHTNKPKTIKITASVGSFVRVTAKEITKSGITM